MHRRPWATSSGGVGPMTGAFSWEAWLQGVRMEKAGQEEGMGWEGHEGRDMRGRAALMSTTVIRFLLPLACLCYSGTLIIIITNRRSGITSSHGHKTGTRSMQPVQSVPLGGAIVS